VKIFRIDLKLLWQLGIGPNFSVMIEAGKAIPKIFARPIVQDDLWLIKEQE